MSNWFRWYEGTTEDGKFRVVARLSHVTVRDVIALWAFILEDAANYEHRGVCERNEDFMASVLDLEFDVVVSVLGAMENLDMISVGHGAITITRWKERQFESDLDSTATARQRRKRERDKARMENGKAVTHADVTRDSRTPDTDSESEAETERKKEREVPLAQNSVPREASKVPPSAAAALEFFKEGSPEDQCWELVTQLSHRGVSRAFSVQLLKLNDGDFDAALVQLRDAAQAQHPPSYLGKIIQNLKDAQAPPTIADIGGPPDEPAFVREYRVEGYNIEHRRKNRWWIAGDLYDETGRVVGC